MEQLQDILETTLGSFLDLVQCDAGSVYTVRNNLLKFEVMITRSIKLRGVPEHLKPIEFAIDDSSLAGKTAAHRKPILHNSILKEGEVSPHVGEVLHYATRNIFSGPLITPRGEMVGVIQLFYQFWPHTRHVGRLGVLDRWIQTPSNHRVHHAQNDLYLDRNYVGVFLLWDHLFGTFQEERDDEPCIYGVRGQLKSWNPVWANLNYYWTMAQDSWHAGSWLDKLKVWYAPPGWRPADVGAHFPKPSYDPHRDFSRFDPPRRLALNIYVLAQFSALLVFHSDFLGLLQKRPGPWNAMYFLPSG